MCLYRASLFSLRGVNDIHTDFFQSFGFSSDVFGTVTAGTNATIDRDAWMVSAKYATGGPLNFRFMYAQADDYDVEATFISGQKNRTNDTGADMLVLGAYYSLGDSTEFGLTYNNIDNDTHGAYGTGIGGYGLGGVGGDNEIFALNVITMF